MGATLSNLALISHHISQYKSPTISTVHTKVLFKSDNRYPETQYKIFKKS